MRFPSFTPMNQPPEQKAAYLPVEEDILLAQKQVEEAKIKYNTTKSVVDKINLEEASMRMDLLMRDRAAANESAIEHEAQNSHESVEELQEVRRKIASAERGVELANTLNDMERLAQMMENLQKLREEEQTIQNRLNEQAANVSAFDEATSREQIAKQDRIFG